MAGRAALSFSVDVKAPAPVKSAAAESVTVEWTPPTENVDGTALVDVSGYNIYYGNASHDYSQVVTVDNPGLTRVVVDSLPPGKYFFAVTVFTSEGIESAFSSEASLTIG